MFDDFDNFYVAACYGCYSQYFVSVGDIQKAAFFINNTKLYLNQLVNKNQLDTELEHAVLISEQATKFNENIEDVFEQVMGSPIGENITGEHIDDLMASICRYTSNLGLSEPVVMSRRLYIKLLGNALKIQLLKRKNEPISEMYLNFANEISSVVDSEYFSICQALVCVALKEAALVHLDYLNIAPTTDVVDKLRKDLKGLRIMSERHGIVKHKYGNLINFLEDEVAIINKITSSVGALSIIPNS